MMRHSLNKSGHFPICPCLQSHVQHPFGLQVKASFLNIFSSSVSVVFSYFLKNKITFETLADEFQVTMIFLPGNETFERLPCYCTPCHYEPTAFVAFLA